MSSVATGGCLCGGVTYVVTAPLRDVWNCHCFRCRRFTGHHMAATRADTDSVTISGTSLQWYSPDQTVAYGFCGTCGSSVFWRAADRPQFLTICAGTLDQPTGLRTTAAWWAAEHGDYHEPDTGIEQHDHDG